MSDVKQKFDLDVSGTISGLERVAGLVDKLEGNLQGLGQSQKNGFSGAEAAVKDFNRELSDGTKIYQKIENSAKGFKQEQERLSTVYQKLRASQKQFIAEGRYSELQQNIAGVKNRIKELGGELDNADKKSKKFGAESESTFSKIGKYIAGAFAIGTIASWAQQAGQAILNVTAEFQKFEAVLTTSLGSNSAAERALNMIQDFAAKTPYSVQELTDSYVKLASRGIRATNKELTALGDLASSTGKSFDQLTEALLDSMSGENERLKEFGITAKKNGETTAFTFKGVTTEVKNSSDAIKDYVTSLGNVEGVTGSMAAISETLTGKLSNLGDTVDQLWLTIGEQETGVMSSFISFLSDAVEYTTFLIANTDQLAKKMTSQAVTDFATTTEADFKKLAESAKASGQDVSTVLEQQSAAMRQKLEADLAAAKKTLGGYEEQASIIGAVLGGTSGIVQYGADKASDAAAKMNVQKISEQLKALEDAKRFVLEDAAKAEDKATQERNAARIKAAQEAAKKEAAARKQALQDLYKQLADLEKEAEKAKLDMLDKNSKAYLDAVLAKDLEEVQEIEKSIRAAQKRAGVAQKLTFEQEQQLRILSQAATKKYYDALNKLEQQERDKLLELQADSDEKTMQQLTNKYDAEIRAAREAGNEEIAIALEVAKKREAARLGRSQQMGQLDFQEQLSTEGAKLDIAKLDGVDEVEKERLLKEKLLQLEEEFALKRLQVLANATDDEALLEQLQLKNKLEEIRNARELMAKESEGFSIQKLLGLTDEQMEGVNIATEQILGQLSDFLAASVEMRQREVEALTNAIDEKGAELDREIELNKEGFASNVETKRQEYEELKKQREKAMKDQQKAQRAQVALDTITQSVNMITAATDIFKSVSAIPVIGVPLAIGLIATMFAAFAASKSKAMQAASVPSFEKGGEGSLIKGASHKQGGIDIIERKSGKLVGNMQGGENFYVTSNKATDQFWPYLELINKQDKKGFLNLALDELLSGTGVIPHPELPQRMQTAQQGAKQAQYKSINEAYFKEMNQHLKTVADNTQQGPTMIDTPTERIYKSGNRTTIIRK